MEIRPILSALLRHKTAALLIVLEIALSCAIVCNAVFIIGSRVEHMQRDSGIVENELVDIQVSSLMPDADGDALRRMDVAALSAIPGVKSVSSVNQIPYGGNVWVTSTSLVPDQPEPTANPSQYMDDGNLLRRLQDERAGSFTGDNAKSSLSMTSSDLVNEELHSEDSSFNAPSNTLSLPICTRDPVYG